MEAPVSDSTAVAVREDAANAAASLGVPLPPVNDAELASLFRVAKGLAESGLFKDAKQAGQAFAKILAGRDLGLTPFEAMSALHVIEGKIEAGADLHATKVRQRDGYDYRVVWLKIGEAWDGKPNARGHFVPPGVVAVAADEEEADDLREVFGCAVEFTVAGKRRGVARWTLEDSRASGLLDRQGPGGGPGNHKKFPRSMYFSRAMSQGVSLHVPEVMGGVRVYALGEIPRDSGPDLTAGEPRGPIGTVPGDDLPTAVEAVIARATVLGHVGLANREAWATRVSGQPAEYVATQVRAATGELNRMAAGKPEPEPVVDATATEDEAVSGDLSPDPAETPESASEAENAPQAPAAPPEPPKFAEPTPAEQAAADELGVAIVSDDFLGDGPPRRAEPAPVDAERIEALRKRGLDLLDDAATLRAEGDHDRADEAEEEAEQIMAEVDAAGDPAQGTLGIDL
jgi:hypothetical protein